MLFLCLVSIVCVFEFKGNWSLFFVMNNSTECNYCDCSGRIFSFLNSSLHDGKQQRGGNTIVCYGTRKGKAGDYYCDLCTFKT